MFDMRPLHSSNCGVNPRNLYVKLPSLASYSGDFLTYSNRVVAGKIADVAFGHLLKRLAFVRVSC